MPKFKGSLLVADFDGTLADSNGNIPKHVKEKIGYYTANGGIFTVCTGRTAQGFHAFENGEFHAPALLANGVMAYDYEKRKIVFCDGIGKESEDIVSLLQKRFPEICIELYSMDFSSYAIHPNERSVRHFANQFISWREISSVEEAVGPFVKIMLSCGVEKGQQIQRFLDEEIVRYGLRYIPSNGDYVEIIRKGCGKAYGMLRFAGACGIDRAGVYAIGDGENDIEMLNAAAIGFAPRNACDAAKRAAKRIVCSNDEGAVADVIDMLEKGIG